MSPLLCSSFPFNQDWLQEEDRYSTLLLFKCDTWDFRTSVCLLPPPQGWLSPPPPKKKKRIKKCSESFVVWNWRVLWKALQIPGVSLSALRSPILGSNASSHFRKHRQAHLTALCSEALCQKQQRDTAKFQPATQTSSLRFCYLKFA